MPCSPGFSEIQTRCLEDRAVFQPQLPSARVGGYQCHCGIRLEVGWQKNRIIFFVLFCYSKDKIKEKIEKSCDDMLRKCKICYESFCSFA